MDSSKGAKSFWLMICEPPYTRPVRTVVWEALPVSFWQGSLLDCLLAYFYSLYFVKFSYIVKSKFTFLHTKFNLFAFLKIIITCFANWKPFFIIFFHNQEEKIFCRPTTTCAFSYNGIFLAKCCLVCKMMINKPCYSNWK